MEEKNELGMTIENPQRWVCKICGGKEVQVCQMVWVNPNTYEIEVEEAEWLDTYCADCEKYAVVITAEEYNKQ